MKKDKATARIARAVNDANICGYFKKYNDETSIYSTAEAAEQLSISQSYFRKLAKKMQIKQFHTSYYEVRHSYGTDKNVTRHLWSSVAIKLIYKARELMRHDQWCWKQYFEIITNRNETNIDIENKEIELIQSSGGQVNINAIKSEFFSEISKLRDLEESHKKTYLEKLEKLALLK